MQFVARLSGTRHVPTRSGPHIQASGSYGTASWDPRTGAPNAALLRLASYWDMDGPPPLPPVDLNAIRRLPKNAVVMEFGPGIGDVLSLREDPAAARGLGVFAIANFAVADRLALQAWATHLDELGVTHGPIIDTPRLSLLVLANPDGQEIHLYTPIRD